MADKILEALNKLVEKQGGTTEDNKLIVDALNDLVESGGSSGGGGSNTLFVKLIKNDDTNELSSTTSVAEIYDALNDGKLVYLRAYNYFPDAPQEHAYETNGTTCFVTAIDWQGEGEGEFYIIRFTENVKTNPAQYNCGIVDGADKWSELYS